MSKIGRKYGRFNVPIARRSRSFELENGFESELNLARSIRTGSTREVCRPLVVSREVSDSNCLIELNEVCCSICETVVGDGRAGYRGSEH